MQKHLSNHKSAIVLLLFILPMVSLPFMTTGEELVLNSNFVIDQSVISQTFDVWNHDCSNVTGFVSQGSWNVDFESDWTITSGTLTSSGTYFHFPDISTGTLWHGPVYVYELPETYPLRNLTGFSVQYDVDNSMGGDAGAIWVYLADSGGDPIITSRVVDDDGGTSKGTLGVEYRTSVNTPYFHGGSSVSFTSYLGDMDVWYNETYGVMANVEGYGETSLYDPTSFEESREIRYVVIMGGRLDGQSPIVFARVLDIMIQFETGSIATSTTTSTIPTITTSTPTTTDTTTTTTIGTTTTSTTQDSGDTMALVAGVSGISIVIVIAAIFVFKKRSSGSPSILSSGPSDVEALRGGEFVGNRFRFKVKVNNSSKRVITDVCVTLTSYPKDSLKLEDEASRTISKLEPKGFRSPTFEFLPTKDCVRGDLIATVSWVDANGDAHSATTKPYTIRAVCDLLKPETITPDDFILKLATLGHGETITKVDDWTPEEMQEKTVQILKDSNFFEVTSASKPVGDYIEVEIQGWAKGMYTGKNLGIQITISGKPHTRGATCKVRVSGEDEAMILPAIDEVSQKLGAWLCPRCGGILPIDAVKGLKGGKSIACPFCNVTIDR